MHSQHIDTDRLLEFLEAPERDTAGCAAHLVDCAECRHLAGNLSRMMADLPLTVAATHYDETWMNEQARALDTPPKEHTHHYHYLHFQLSRQASTIHAVPLANPVSSKREGWLVRVLRPWRSPIFRSPALIYAAVATLALGVSIFLRTAPSSPVLAAYTSQDYLLLEPRSSGMHLGFFDAAQQTRQAFGPIDVQWSNNTLNAAWPEVRDTTGYEFEVSATENGEVKSLGHYTGRAPRASMTSIAITPGKHYQWRLSGLTSDDRQFHIEGGFVLSGGDLP